jgi:hypothetical protein
MAVEFLSGPAGVGKSTYAVQRLERWLADGVPPHQILVLIPQRALGRPYHQFLRQSAHPNALNVALATFTGLAQRGLNLYWNGVAPQLIPNWDGHPPTYLNIETAQYYMAQFVDPVFEQGRFDAVSLDRPRLTAQILNNLSAAAVNRFPLAEVLERLTQAWLGQSSRIGVYQAAIEVAQNFRQHCLEQGLLDFSLQVEAFVDYVIPIPHYEQTARQTYRYVIADNLEENFPVALDFIYWLADSFDEALLIYDEDAGYRVFLGAAPQLAQGMASASSLQTSLEQPYQQSRALTDLTTIFQTTLDPDAPLPTLDGFIPSQAFTLQLSTFYPQMVDWIADQTIHLVNQGVSPSEIVILAPFLGDSLRFSLLNQLEKANIPYLSQRPSRAIQDEPMARAILTLMKLVYHGWATPPNRTEFARMLAQVVSDFDPIRADLLAQIVYRPPNADLGAFEAITPTMQSRITYALGERYETLRAWIAEQRAQIADAPPDYFIRRAFDLLSQQGYGFYQHLEAGRIATQLIDSAYHFRSVLAMQQQPWPQLTGQYIELVGDGLLASAYANVQWDSSEAVWVMPAYSFLMRNKPVDYQLWVDVGSNAWFERIEQPVTHPYVLRRDFPIGQPWTDDLESSTQSDFLRRVLLGLTRRCRQHLYLGFADLGEQGFEQRGILMRQFNRILGTYGNHSLS